MKDFAGKTAFITGGAGGIGLAMARTFGQRGMKVSIADVEAETCAKAVEALRLEGIIAIGSVCDVSNRDALAEAAAKTFAEFGKVHVLCNNAGVSPAWRSRDRIPLRNSRWSACRKCWRQNCRTPRSASACFAQAGSRPACST